MVEVSAHLVRYCAHPCASLMSGANRIAEDATSRRLHHLNSQRLRRLDERGEDDRTLAWRVEGGTGRGCQGASNQPRLANGDLVKNPAKLVKVSFL